VKREAEGVKRHEMDIPDAQVRRLAETTFDRNVVVVAGAGTGKTTLLVNRLIHLLMREPDPVPVMRLVALTFTNKAATEMKVRLRERLKVLMASGQGARNTADPGAVSAEDLRERYGLSADHIADRARAALQDLEKAQIGTLHSFAAHLLRLHPLESGVDPNFQTDDGELRFEEHFRGRWDLWLDRELGPDGAQHGRWRRVLAEAGLETIRELAYALRSELIPLEELRAQAGAAGLSAVLRAWFAARRDRAGALLAAHDGPKRRKIESMLAAAQALFDALAERGLERFDAERVELARDAGEQPAGWSGEDFAEAAGLIRTAKLVLAVDHGFMGDLLALVSPFVQAVRDSFLAEGWISFDGLLARARALLRDHPAVRERLKHDYRAVLVDEFQDTDPVQYEIILYLAERAGRHAADWREVETEPGKLFIVGDPKQSIYAFRRADIEAFDQVVGKLQSAGGLVYELTTNFRSHQAVLDVVNPLFDRLLRRQENVQPPNVPLVVRPQRRGGVAHPGVELRLVRAEEDGELESQAATRIEADQLARWLKDEVLEREILTDAQGRSAPLRPGHVALLFRTLTHAQDYLDALRRHELAYVTDGEKHFYRRQEVVDLVNLLRVIDNPHDAIALVGVLRSPLGGVTDRDLVGLRECGALDYRRADRLPSGKDARTAALRSLYDRLAGLNRDVRACPLPDAVDRLFERLPVLELAAASLHGEQAVANLMKVRQMAVELADRPYLTLTGFIEVMMARLSEQPEEAESALSEESLDAVRVMTIHKAKGLEFPVVILPGFHHGTGRGRETPPVSHDWSSGVLGVSLGERCSLGAVLVGEKLRLREEAERRRLFYVGMTRAKERLILSGGLSARAGKGAFLGLLQEAVSGEIGQAGQPALRVGPVSFGQTVVATSDRAPRRRRGAPERLHASTEWKSLAPLWERRDRDWNTACAMPTHLTPTRLAGVSRERPGRAVQGGDASERARLIGTVAHCVLQHWNFSDAPGKLTESIAAACRRDALSGWAGDLAGVQRELHDMLQAFAGSAPYRELQRAEILGREVPFAMSWEGNRLWAMGYGAGKVQADSSLSPIAYRPLPASCVMEGVIDVLYRLDGRIHLADYKTDRVEDSELADRAAAYEGQVQVYREAVARCLGVKQVGVQLIFLRNGKAVSL
jgi:ATP-dependent helicase/nuclease subunit A